MRPLFLLLPMALSACSSGIKNDTLPPDVEAQVNVDAIDSARDVGLPDSTPPVEAPAPGTPGGLANDMTPISEAPFTPESAQGAAQVVQTYFALLEERKFGEAWTLWEDKGKASGKKVEAFAADFDLYAEYHANIGAPGKVDAGAGQRFVTVPVITFGRLKGGKPFNQKGEVTLHRTIVDGTSNAQRAWHIRSINLAAVP